MNRLGWELCRAGVPYVFTSHGHLLCHGRVHWLKKFVYLNLVSHFIRRAAGLHFCTQREAERNRLLLPFWRGQRLVLHNLVQVPDPSTVAPWPREQLGIPDRAFVFAYLGRMHVECKGLDLLVEAFASLPANANAFLVMVGPDFKGGRQRLTQLVSDLGCGRRVRFLESQVGDRKWSILRMADAFASPSRWESFGLAAVEAMGFGLPTILSTTACVTPEVIERKAALASPPSAHDLARLMRELMENEPTRRSLADAGRKWVLETCSLETAGARFAEFYSRVLQFHDRSVSRS